VRRLRFLDEPQLTVGVGHLVGRQNLDGDKAVQLRTAGLIDDAHTALAHHLDQLVMRDVAGHHGVPSRNPLTRQCTRTTQGGASTSL
jgi:hypothetical protein